ncbi:hypothetical protein N6H18_04560 [Reichenbachiella agarivorans]|uniref:Two component regulator three Y domain-containing protein n=1 Tax=Reichenbachiella agarivorans TaxID=2979464 RepID=A0ABY6CV18_9BACT|nr:two-component regulator propeller domain-containing protein [Reichenbachiella agarivorans]UXP33223.1 hypothetical protein N6H18_04560 [Reichenbachiella agarivorans]
MFDIKKHLFFLVLLVILGSSMFAIAQKAAIPEAPKLYFDHLEGLHNNQITGFCQDHKGYMWIATENGLHRYNGVNYRLFLNNGDSSSINSSRVKCLMEDHEGTLWMGSTDGLFRYNRELDKLIPVTLENEYFPEQANPNVILDMVEDTVRKKVWIASLSEGLLVYDYTTEKLTPYFKRDGEIPLKNYSLNSLALKSLLLDQDNNRLWIGHYAKGLNIIDLDTQEVRSVVLLNNEEDTVQQLTTLRIVREGVLWVGTLENGIFEMNLNGEHPKVQRQLLHIAGDKNSLYNDYIESIYLDRENRIWVCNDNGGLHLYDDSFNGFHRYIPDNKPHSIVNISVRCVYQDRQNRLWVGTALEGVDVADPMLHKFHHLMKSNYKSQTLSSNIIRDFHEDESGKIWIATDGGGINIYDPATMKIDNLRLDEEVKNSISSDAVLCMLDIDQSIWIGTWNGGINIIDKKSRDVKRFQPTHSSLKSIFSLIEDRDGFIWGTSFSNGLQRINKSTGEVRSYRYDATHEYGLKSNMVYALFEDSQGNIWVGGEAKGLYILRYENKEMGKFEGLNFTTEDVLDIASDWVSQIYEDKDHRIYCATSSGLIEVDPTTMNFEFVLRNKLPTTDIRSIIEDQKGNLWLATTLGLSKYDPVKDSVLNFSVRDGLQRGKFTKNTIMLTKGNLIYVGGSEGVNLFDPLNIPFNRYKPDVHLAGLKLFNNRVQVGDSTALLKSHIAVSPDLIFHPDQWRFTLEYIALNFTRPDFNQYAYMLEGMEEEWNYVGNQREVTYTHLNPGSYTFKVKAANNDGVWQEQPAMISITVLPPWWRTWWAVMLCVFVLILCVMGYVRWRTYKLSARERELRTMVKMRTSELSDKNRELEELNKAITDQAEELRTYNEALNAMNEKLEELVEIRTQKIREKNGKLTKFAFDNAHRVRGPLTRIMGMMNLIEKESELTEREFWIEKVAEASREMDEITRSMGSEIDEHLKDDV